MNNRIQRRRQRGAALVEAITVISFFTVCFLGVLYFKELYLAKLHVQRIARASAMGHAMGACEGEPAAGLDEDLQQRPLGRAREPGEPRPPLDAKGDRKAGEALAGFDQAKTGTPLNAVTKITLASKASATSGKDQASTQGFTGDVSSTSFVTCGDPVADGQYTEIIPHITSLF